MKYNTIVNPITNRKVSIYSDLGYKILRNYVIQSGGATLTKVETPVQILTLKQSISQREAINKVKSILTQLNPDTSERELKLQAFELVEPATDDRGRVPVSFIQKWEQEQTNSKSDDGKGLKRFIAAIRKVAQDNRAKKLVNKLKTTHFATKIQAQMRKKISKGRVDELRRRATTNTEMRKKLHRGFTKLKAIKNILDIKHEIAQKKLKARQNWKKIKNLTKATSAFNKNIIKDDLGVKPADYDDRYKAELAAREQYRLYEDDDDEDLQETYNYFAATLDKVGSLSSSTLKSLSDWKLSRYNQNMNIAEKQLKSRYKGITPNTSVETLELLLSDMNAFINGYRNRVGIFVSGWRDNFTDSDLEMEYQSDYSTIKKFIKKRAEVEKKQKQQRDEVNKKLKKDREETALKRLFKTAKTYNDYQRFIKACDEHLYGNNNLLWGKKDGYGKFDDKELHQYMESADDKAQVARIREEKEEEAKIAKAQQLAKIAEKRRQEKQAKDAERQARVAEQRRLEKKAEDAKMAVIEFDDSDDDEVILTNSTTLGERFVYDSDENDDDDGDNADSFDYGMNCGDINRRQYGDWRERAALCRELKPNGRCAFSPSGSKGKCHNSKNFQKRSAAYRKSGYEGRF